MRIQGQNMASATLHACRTCNTTPCCCHIGRYSHTSPSATYNAQRAVHRVPRSVPLPPSPPQTALERRLTRRLTTTAKALSTNTECLTDQNDESLRKWKASLGLGQGESISDASDPRKVIILSLGLEVEGRPDIIIELNSPGALESLNKHPFTIKEGATFRMKAKFKVQHQILSGLKYVQVVSRMGMKNKMQEMIVSRPHCHCSLAVIDAYLQGSYSPNTTDRQTYEKKCESTINQGRL